MSNSENERDTAHDLVIVGASAGGIKALSIFVSTLTADFPAPIILAQHLDSSRPSNLNDILQQRTPLPVMLVTSSAALEAGKIYVVPANRHILVRDHHVELQEERGKRPRPSIDALLSSAAEIYGDHLIAIILTGSGIDGAAGAVDVKKAGGTVIIQDPSTAHYPSMPLALPPPVVDFAASIENIASLLYDLLTGIQVVQTTEHIDDTLQSILEQVSQQASIDFRPYKTSTILRRISRRIAVTHVHTIQEYEKYLQNYPAEVGELVKAFLINVTQFFRDADAFLYLKNDILPKLIANAREQDKILRFWTAGCATGEEPYSLAMLISEMLGTELSAWSIKIFATDLDEESISFARRGIYAENLLKNLPDDYRESYFERVDQGYRISKILRQMVIFGQQDLSRSAPFPRINLVLCRNVLIYFSSELQEYVLSQFAFSLLPAGYLFLGKAETVRPQQSFFELVNKQWKVYRCTGGILPAISRYLPERVVPALEGHARSRLSKKMNTSDPQNVAPSITEYGQLRRFNELLLRFLPIGIIVIDRNYHMLTANSAARRLLGFRDIASDQDFLHAVYGIPYTVTRTAIDTVFRERNVVTLPEIELDIASGGNGRFLSLSIALMQAEVNIPELAAISVSDVTEQVHFKRQLEVAQAEHTQLMSELSTTNKRLNYVNKELMDANEELQVANEELMLTHEELQASIEEFETTNEELQATNEELETNNEELQATNEELETTNEELRARSTDLQEAATTLNTERALLAEIVELAPFYIMVLRGPLLIVDAYNSQYIHTLEDQDLQNGPLEEVIDTFWDIQLGKALVQKAHEAYEYNEKRTISRTAVSSPQETEASTVQQGFFTYTFAPSHDMYGRVNGVIIYSLDETKQYTEDLEEERAQLKLIFDNTTSALLALYDATTNQLQVASPGYRALLAHIKKTSFSDSSNDTWQEETIITPSEQAETIWNSVKETRSFIRLPEVTYTFEDGQETFWDFSITPINDGKSDTIRFMLISMVDVTEQVRARREVEHLDSIKDDFFSITTHELRSPLTTILGNAQILLKSIKKQAPLLNDGDSLSTQFEQWISGLDKIVRHTKKINVMLSDMVDVTRMNRDIFELRTQKDVNIVELVQRVVEQQTMMDANRHILVFTPPSDAMLSSIDVSRIEQVLNNLISNALKYSSSGKTVEVSLSYSTDEQNMALIAIRDEGRGISSKDQKHIFERFYRANNDQKVDGLGLGLYIAHEIVIRHGGRMWLESIPNVGSTFYFVLPLQ